MNLPSATLRTVRADDGPLLRELTISSVEDSPHAFGGAETLAEEQARTDAQWSEFAAECAGEVEAWRERCVAYFVEQDGVACGKAIVFLSKRAPIYAQVNGAWIDPRYRGRGLGRQMIDAAQAWALARGADRIRLWVDDRNPAGAAFYRAIGFVPTGLTRPVSPQSADLESGFERVFA